MRPRPDAATDGDARTPTDPALQDLLRDVAAKRLDQLDALPADIGERIRALTDYDFLEPEARSRFDELVATLQRQVMDQFVGGMAEQIRSMTPEDLAANREMVKDLNELMRQRIGGFEPDVREFLAKHGAFFPGAQTFDDILDQLAQRMAAMQSLLRSMTPEQRAELESMMDALLRDDRLLVDLAQLASNLDLLLPGGLGERMPFSGDQPLGFDGALSQIARLQAMDRLQDALSDVEGPEDLAALDRDRGPRPARRRRRPGPRRPRRPGSPPRGRRLPDAPGRSPRTDRSRHAADRPEGPRRPVLATGPRRVRRPPDRPIRARRRARGDDQAVRVRRPVPPGPARARCSTRSGARRTLRRRAGRRGSGSRRRTSRSIGPRS